MMKRVNESVFYAWVGAALGLGVATSGGCNQGSTGEAKRSGVQATTPAEGGAAKTAGASGTAAVPALGPIEYKEIPSGKRLVVVGTKKGAEEVARGGKPTSYVAEIGYGPGGQTVYFENKPDGMEKALKAEYAKRHPAGQ
jgi:hypothetical protein